MKNIKNLKIVTIISFLIIVFPGKIAFINFIILPLPILNFVLMLGVDSVDLMSFSEPIISIITILSIFYIFNQKKHIVISSIIIQYLYLTYLFKAKFLNYWYFTIPTTIYLILSLLLIYNLFSHQKKATNN